jgi:hypothetical protein
MYKLNNIDDVLLWWMEELPLDEISSDRAAEIIESFRNGHLSILEALEDLETECFEDIEEYLKRNKEIKKEFKNGK